MTIDKINTVICGDCLEVLKDFEDNSVDLVLTDFPYGVGVEYDCFIDTQSGLIKLISGLMPEILRVSKRTVFTCGNGNMWLYPAADWAMAWVNPAGAHYTKWGFSCWQPILCYGKDPYLENGMGARRDIIYANETSEKFGHPCSKPIEFWKELLLRVSVFETDLIIDPMCGSGTTCVAAKMLGRRYIGIDISEEYCEIARMRLKAVDTGVPVAEQRIGQQSLFEREE